MAHYVGFPPCFEGVDSSKKESTHRIRQRSWLLRLRLQDSTELYRLVTASHYTVEVWMADSGWINAKDITGISCCSGSGGLRKNSSQRLKTEDKRPRRKIWLFWFWSFGLFVVFFVVSRQRKFGWKSLLANTKITFKNFIFLSQEAFLFLCRFKRHWDDMSHCGFVGVH